MGCPIIPGYEIYTAEATWARDVEFSQHSHQGDTTPPASCHYNTKTLNCDGNLTRPSSGGNLLWESPRPPRITWLSRFRERRALPAITQISERSRRIVRSRSGRAESRRGRSCPEKAWSKRHLRRLHAVPSSEGQPEPRMKTMGTEYWLGSSCGISPLIPGSRTSSTRATGPSGGLLRRKSAVVQRVSSQPDVRSHTLNCVTTRSPHR